jgi:hypothetical protein
MEDEKVMEENPYVEKARDIVAKWDIPDAKRPEETEWLARKLEELAVAKLKEEPWLEGAVERTRAREEVRVAAERIERLLTECVAGLHHFWPQAASISGELKRKIIFWINDMFEFTLGDLP